MLVYFFLTEQFNWRYETINLALSIDFFFENWDAPNVTQKGQTNYNNDS